MIKLRNTAQNNEIVFDNVYYTLNELDLGAADADLSLSQGVNQIGAYLNSVSIGTREISIVGFVLADNDADMLERKRNLTRLVSPLTRFQLIKNDYLIDLVGNDTVHFGVARYANNKYLAQFMISATAINPYFHKEDSRVVPLSYWSSEFHFPKVFEADKPFIFGARQNAIDTGMIVENRGIAPSGCIIKVKPTEKALSNGFTIWHNNKEFIRIEKPIIEPNEEIIINTNYGEKSVIGRRESEPKYKNYIGFLYITSSFFQVNEGVNIFKVESEDNSHLSVSIEFNEYYSEV